MLNLHQQLQHFFKRTQEQLKSNWKTKTLKHKEEKRKKMQDLFIYHLRFPRKIILKMVPVI